MRILFISSNRIGDAVLSTGLLAGFMERYPDAKFWVACGPLAVPIFEHAPGVERVISMQKAPRAGHWRKLLRATIIKRWDVVVDLRGSATSWLLWTKKRHFLKSDHTLHRVVHNAQVGGFDPAPCPRLWPGEASRARARQMIPDGRLVLAMGPTAAWPRKMWTMENFVTLARRLTEPNGPLEGAHLLISGGPDERERCAPLFDIVPEDRLIAMFDRGEGMTSGELSLVGACFERVQLYVGNDSGLMHLAAAAGAPTVGLFGPTSEQLYGPWGDNAVSVRGRSQTDILAETGTEFTGGNGMRDLSVDEVLNASTKLLARMKKGFAALMALHVSPVEWGWLVALA